MPTNTAVVYISPNGSTGKVAEALARGLSQDENPGDLVNLADAAQVRALSDRMKTGGLYCLAIGSPVYRDMAVPPVMAFIDGLTPAAAAWAVPFVTYGMACSGVALWQMATALQAKGIRIAGAAKVAAVHAMMWQSDSPVGQGHPDAGDFDRVCDLGRRLRAMMETGTLAPLPAAALDYHTEARSAEFKAKIAKPWTIIPKTVDRDACTGCGICADGCPAHAITLDPAPVFGGACFDCFNCVRLCPEGAITPAVPMAKIAAMIRERAKSIDERPLTALFPE